MRVYAGDAIRNVAVVGHGGSGKTSLVDTLAFVSGSSKASPASCKAVERPSQAIGLTSATGNPRLTLRPHRRGPIGDAP